MRPPASSLYTLWKTQTGSKGESSAWKSLSGQKYLYFSERSAYDLNTIPERERDATALNMEDVTDLLRDREQEEMFQPMRHLSGLDRTLIWFQSVTVPAVPIKARRPLENWSAASTIWFCHEIRPLDFKTFSCWKQAKVNRNYKRIFCACNEH